MSEGEGLSMFVLARLWNKTSHALSCIHKKKWWVLGQMYTLVVRRLIVFICLFQQSGVWRCRTTSTYPNRCAHTKQNQNGTDTDWKFSCSQAIIVLFLFSISWDYMGIGYRPTSDKTDRISRQISHFFQCVPKTNTKANLLGNLVLHLRRACNFSVSFMRSWIVFYTFFLKLRRLLIWSVHEFMNLETAAVIAAAV